MSCLVLCFQKSGGAAEYEEVPDLLLLLFIHLLHVLTFKVARECMDRCEYRKLHHKQQKGCPLLDLDGYSVCERACVCVCV